MAKIVIGCKLPHGLILENPLNPAETVKLNGLNSSLVIGAKHATTEVEKDFWDLWQQTNKDFPALKNKAIFVAKDQASADAIAKETKDEKTGLEPLKPNDPKNGVKTEDGK